MEVVREVETVGDEPAAPGPAPSFAAWVVASGPRLQRFAYLLTGSAADAPDLVQEALFRAYPRWRSLSRRGTADAYVRRAIVNASISRWRRERHLVVVPEEHLDGREDVRPDHAAAVSDADAAWRLCGRLPAQQRAAVVLRFYEDLDYEQIGAVLGCPAATARSHVHRALAALRVHLGEAEG
jgi:RNA polymerase sigma-70 factor (sigma-E family)